MEKIWSGETYQKNGKIHYYVQYIKNEIKQIVAIIEEILSSTQHAK